MPAMHAWELSLCSTAFARLSCLAILAAPPFTAQFALSVVFRLVFYNEGFTPSALFTRNDLHAGRLCGQTCSPAKGMQTPHLTLNGTQCLPLAPPATTCKHAGCEA
eukprot:1157686-Pelagomonas_calceolata.AAC.9